MTQEEKQLLLIDLSARLPYHPILNWKFINNTSKDEELKELSDLHVWWITKAQDCVVKPYLRPMSSMTEEERRYCYEHAILFSCDINHNIYFDGFGNISADETIDGFDWLNAHHFDYRGLIEKGLALEAKEGMYK